MSKSDESKNGSESGGSTPPVVETVQFLAPTVDPEHGGVADEPQPPAKSAGQTRRVSAPSKRAGDARTAVDAPKSAAALSLKPKSAAPARSADRRRKASECVVADPEELFESLGVTLQDSLMTLALTHRSWANEHGEVPTNERLEFLGDTVLGLVVTEQLYVTHPDKEEGELAKLRANIVSTTSLAEIARRLGKGGLGEYLYLGNGEVRTGGKDKDSILADGLEAVIGAVHIQYGIDKAREVVLGLCAPLLSRAARLGAGLDWKTSLQELCARRGLRPPVYEVTEAGPDHEKLFTAIVLIEEKSLGTGSGRTKKEAEMKAAGHAWGVISGEDVALPGLGL
jgi:ribonuclease-3